ncbi:cation-translocating P-type ATPase [Sphingomonas montana]|uniref:cation-translocating P-type ATPase n=1 Tax=Sphingomonas montana TaxID=1843236 RepID=UPI0009F8C0A1|nr:HAD-IC family P-type ATPase [Sphingomonas montana]
MMAEQMVDRTPRAGSGVNRRDWHATSIENTMSTTGTPPDGLTVEEAALRLERDGFNELAPPYAPSLLRLFLKQFNSPLIYLLVAAAVVSLSLGHMTDAGFIGLVLLVNSVIGTVQEGKAAASLTALRHMIGHSANVRRGGAAAAVDARQVVVGDIVEVESGMSVPADIRLMSSRNLLIDQSTFSGESVPVEKSESDVLAPKTALGDRTTMILAGTMVDQGRGAGIVVATGSATELGAIDATLRTTAPTPPPLVLSLERLARQISIATVGLIIPFALILLWQGRPSDEVLILAVALAVSAIPEGLSIAVTVALAAGSRRMAGRNVIVRSLPAVEGLGACTMIASDKTGTLTQNILSVERIILADGATSDRSDWSANVARLTDLYRAAAICNEASIDVEGEFIGDTVDVALLRLAREGGQDIVQLHATGRVAELPYEPARKFSSVTIEEAGGHRLYVKGAPETVLPMCDDIDTRAVEVAEAMARDGYRVLAIAASPAGVPPAGDVSAPAHLALLGWVGLIDPIRPEVPAAIAECGEAGIAVRMVTGDHPGTALTIARQLGIEAEPDQVVTGAQMTDLFNRPDELTRRILAGRVFARIEPNQKLRIVQLLAESGELVAVTGDGVNDAPALHAAHIGVAMGRAGTDVARDAADLVLADDNFASIVAGVEEGRVTYANVRKIVIFLITTSIAEIAMFLGAVATGLPMPLTAVQLLWLNLVTNGAQDVMLGFGRGEGDELKQAPRSPATPLLDRSAFALMMPPAMTMTVLALVMAYDMRTLGLPLAEIQNGVLLMVVLFQNVYVLCMRSERRPIWREPLFSNPWLLLVVGTALCLQLTAMFWSPLSRLLGTGPVSRHTLLFCAAATAATLVVTEVTKLIVAKWQGDHRAEPRVG